MNRWGGGVHYVTHFPVLKPSSESTKVRIVSDSKMKNNTTQLSFNDLIQDLPNALSELLVVILHWRCHPTALMYDLAKAYQSIRTGEKEKHLRRFFYRSDTKEEFKTYAYDRATFGDNAASAALEFEEKKNCQTFATC